MNNLGLLLILILAVGILIIGETKASGSSLSTSNPFYPSYFSPNHQQLMSQNYQPAITSYSMPPFYWSLNRFPYSFYEPGLSSYYSPHTSSFEFPTLSGDYEEELSRKWFSRTCPPAITLNPCSCFSKRVPLSRPISTIVCPSGTSAAIIQSVFSNIPPGLNIDSVTMSLPQGASVKDYIPTIFGARYPTTTINVVYPTPTPPPPPAKSCGISNTIWSPCSCNPNNAGNVGTITCPVETTLAQFQTVFSNIPANTNLGNVILNIPAGTTGLPPNLLGNNAANTIQLIGAPAQPLSQLAVDGKGFAASAATATVLTIEQFDVGNLDYTFLTGFKALTKIQLNKCSNNPTVLNAPKNLPTFPNLVPFLVDGVVFNSKCPDAALLAPCTCSIPKGDQVITTTCPFGSSMLDIMTAFSNFPYSTDLKTVSNVGNVVINFPSSTETVIPLTFLGSNEAATIKLIGPPANPLSKLTVAKTILPVLAFSVGFRFGSQRVTDFSIENFDVVNLDYGFLSNFKFLTNIEIKKCTNAPSKVKPPTNLPTNLLNLKTISVDGTNIYTPKRR